MKMRNTKRSLITLIASALLGILMVCAAVIGFTGLNFNGAKTANATATGTQINLGTGGFAGNTTAKTNLPTLYTAIAGSGNNTYAKVKSSLANTNGTILKTAITTHYVTMGGYNWNIMAVSKDSSGDVIVTLWMATTLETYNWNTWYNAATTYNYPGNMYSSSAIRARLVGTNYVASAGATSLTSGSGLQNSGLKTFITNYTGVLDTPSQIAYQGTESAVASIGQSYIYPNEAYGTPSTGNYYSSGSYNTNYTSKTGYTGWSADKLWLPSLTETGFNDTTNGLWKTTAAQRTGDGSNVTWLRSGGYANGSTAYRLYADGSSYRGSSTSGTIGVRPALHLNLKSAASAAGLDVNDGVTVPTFSSSSTFTISTDKLTATAAYATSARTITTTAIDSKITVTTSSTSITRSGTTITVAASLAPGTYTVTLALASGNNWADNTTANKTLTIKINKANQAAITISGTTTVAYGSTTKLTAGGGSGTGAFSWSSSNTGVATIASDGTVTPVAQGTTTITLNKATDTNYNAATAVTTTVTVQRAAIAIPTLSKGTGAATGSTVSGQTATTTYTGSAQHFTLSAAPSTITFGTPTTGATRSGTDFYATNCGTYTVSMSIDSTKYCWGSTNGGTDVAAKTLTLTINKAGQAAITISGGTSVVYGSTLSLTSGGGSGTGAFSWSTSDATIATVSNGVVTPIKVGSVTITLNKAGDTNYNAATAVTTTVTVQPKGVAVPTLTAGSGADSSATISGLNVTATYNGGAQHYTLSAAPSEITFGTPTTGATLSGRDFSATNTGTYTVSLSIDGDKYCWGTNGGTDTAAKTLTLKINKASFDLSELSFTDATTTYDGNTHSITLTGGTVPNGLNVSYTYNGNTEAGNAVKNAGTYEVKAIFTVDDSTNYEVPAAKTATLIINKAKPVISVSGVKTSYTYNGALQTVTGASVSSPVVGGYTGGGVQYSNNTFTTVAQGNGLKVLVYVNESTNFEYAEVEVTISVAKANLTLKWNGGEGTYEPDVEHTAALIIDTAGTLPQMNDRGTITNANLATAVTVRYLKGSNTLTKAVDAGTYQPTYTLPTGEPYANYNITVTNEGYTFEVKKATVTGVDFLGDTVTYDGKVHRLAISGTELPAEVTVSYVLSGSSTVFNGRTAVKYLSGAVVGESVDAVFACATGNYEVPATKTAVLTINPKAIAKSDIEGVAEQQVYNGIKVQPNPTVSVLLAGNTNKTTLTKGTDFDVAYVSSSTDASVDHVGDNVTVKITGKGNYSGTIDIDVEVTKATLAFEWTITGATEDNPTHGVYTYNGYAQGNKVTLTGVAYGDTIVPVIKYIGVDNDWDSEELPTDAGEYRVVASFTEDCVQVGNYGNYFDPEDQETTFTINKAKPTASIKYVSWNGTAILWAGHALPEITLDGEAMCNGIPVDGTVDWALVNGARPALVVGTRTFTWEFVPTSSNYEVVTGTVNLTAQTPVLKDIAAKWTEDIPEIIYTSATLTDIRQYIFVDGHLDNGEYFGEITGYNLSGSWGSATHPSRYGTYTLTIAYGEFSVTLTHYYTEVTLESIEVQAADGKEIKTEYLGLEEFDTTTIKVVAHYTDGSTKEISSNDYVVKYYNNRDCLWASHTYITISYSETPETFDDVEATCQVSVSVSQRDYDMSGIKVTGGTYDYDGESHEATITGEFPEGSWTVKYEKQTSAGKWTEVTDATEAGYYRVTVDFTLEGLINTTNYYAIEDVIVYITINKIDYEWAKDVDLKNVTVPYAHGESVADEIKVTGVPAEFTGVTYSYVDAAGKTLTADEVITVGKYTVTVTFTVDDNHNGIASLTATLTVVKADPDIDPYIEGDYLTGAELGTVIIKDKKTVTEGTFTWDNPKETLIYGSKAYNYTFTPDDTDNYNVKKGSIYILTADKKLIAINVTIEGDGTIFTSTTVEKLQQMLKDGELTMTIIGSYVDGAFNPSTSEITPTEEDNFYIYYLDDKEYLEAGRQYIGVYFNGVENTRVQVTVVAVELGSIEANFEQNGEKIYTSGDIKTLEKMIEDELVNLTVTGMSNDGIERNDVTYTLSGDWSGLTADGKYSVTVTALSESGKEIKTTFEIDVTVKALEGITAEYKQNGAKIYESDKIDKFESLITNEKVDLTVSTKYNDGIDNEISAGDYSLKIVDENGDELEYFKVGCGILITYEGKEYTIYPDVDEVLVDRITARLTNNSDKVYTDTTLDELKGKLTVTAYYNDGTSNTVTDFKLSLPEGNEEGKLPAAAQTTITVTYTGTDVVAAPVEYELVVGVFKHDTKLTIDGSLTHVYDGEEHEHGITAKVNYEGAVITYKLTYEGEEVDGWKEVGSYTLNISVAENDDYYGTELSVTITVSKAIYDLSEITFEDKSVEYDGTAKSLAIAEILPEGVTVTYVYTQDGNEVDADQVIDAGTYTVTAKFTSTNVNYDDIKDLTATLTIEQAKIDMSGVAFDDKTETYSGTAYTITLDESTLPAGVKVAGYTYSPDDEDGAINAGKYTVTVSFELDDEYAQNYAVPEDMTAVLTIEKANVELDFDGALTKVYDGKENAHGITATANYEGATVTYKLSFGGEEVTGWKEVGTYTLEMTVAESQNYFGTKLTVKIEVIKATYDLSGISFKDTTVTYDGSAKALEITGTLPTGVTVTYVYTQGGDEVDASNVKNAGTYTVTATFASDDANYNDIAEMTATLTIDKATYDFSKISFEDKTETYDGTAKTFAISGTLPMGVTVTYYNADGGESEDEFVAAGTYTVTAKFTGDADNYNEIADMTATLTIEKDSYDLSGIKLDDKTVTYDGTAKALEITGTLPEGVDVEYVYTQDGKTVTEVKNAGVYTVTAKFTSDNDSYDEIEDLTATLTIEKATFDMSGIVLGKKTVTYDGTKHSLTLGEDVTLPEGLAIAAYTYSPEADGGAINAGKYTVTLSFKFDGEVYELNYELPEDVIGELNVERAELKITAEDVELTYGDPMPAKIEYTPEGLCDGDEAILESIQRNCAYAQYSKAGPYTITLSGIVTDNYKVTYVQGTLTVKKLAATVVWTVGEYIYDGLPHMPEAYFVNVFGDKVTLNMTFTSKGSVVASPVNVGNYVATASVNDANYELDEVSKPFVIKTVENTYVVSFVKPYTVSYGSVPSTEEELAALAEKLITEGYVEVSGGETEDIIEHLTVKLVVDNGNVGRYTPYFVFKPEYEEQFADYTIAYQTNANGENNNIGMFVIGARVLTVSFDNTDFIAGNKIRLPKLTVAGFIDEEPFEITLASATTQAFVYEKNGEKIIFTVTVNGDLTSAGGHTVTVTLDNANYAISNPATTVSIAAPVDLQVTWDKTTFRYDGETTHLPVATISGFADGSTVKLALTSAESGTYEVEVNGKVLTFNVTIKGAGNLVEVGEYTVALSVDGENYTIHNPEATIEITNDTWATPLVLALIAAGSAFALFTLILLIVVIVRAKNNKNGSSEGFDYDEGGFNEPYLGEDY